MNRNINFMELSGPLTKKLFELGHQIKESSIPAALQDLVNIRASQLNHCAFCLDMHVKEAKIHGERELRVHHVAIWRESQLFTDKERAAFEWTEAVTQLDGKGISEEIFERVSAHFSEKEMSDLTYVIATINFWNRLNVSFPKTPGSLDTMLGLSKAGLQ
jgi:AhpD family alkylhydroperoxidase